MNSMPDYSTYSREELEDVLRHIDRDRYPDRLSRIEQELEKRKVVTPGRAPIAPWFPKSRVLAFSLDYILVQAVVGLVDNLMFFPIPNLLSSVIPAFAFCLYFAATEGFGPHRASLGKRLLGICVAGAGESRPPLVVILIRALIVCSLYVLDWEETVAGVPVPIGVGKALAAIALGVGVYNIWLSLFGGRKAMVQDILTGTHISNITDTQAEDSEIRAPQEGQPFGWTKPILLVILCTLSLGATLIWNVAWGIDLGQIPDLDRPELHELVEKKIVDELNIRTKVTITQSVIFELGGGSRRIFETTIWIPFVRWNRANREAVKAVFLKSVELDNSYDSRSLKMMTGSSLFTFSIEKTW